jgi:hypothetical protein
MASAPALPYSLNRNTVTDRAPRTMAALMPRTE